MYRITARQGQQAERWANKLKTQAEDHFRDGNYDLAEQLEKKADEIYYGISRLRYGEGTIQDVRNINSAVANRDYLDGNTRI